MSSGEWSGEDEIECATCGELFESEDALQEHSREEHPDRDAH
jgi:hypothetical protein